MAREPVEEAPMLPTKIVESPNRGFLVDLDRVVRSICAQYGTALNDDLITIPDFVRTVTSAYTMLDTDRYVLADASGGAFSVTLPLSADAEPHVFCVKRTSVTGTVTITTSGSDTIDGVAPPGGNILLTAQYQLAQLIPDRVSDWCILHTGAP